MAVHGDLCALAVPASWGLRPHRVELAIIETRLKGMPAPDQEGLINRGYPIADAGLRGNVEPDIHAALVPHGRGGVA